MKTSEIKNFALRITKPTQLKLADAKPDNQFTFDDLANIDLVYDGLIQAKQKQFIISHDLIQINCDILKKLRRIVKQTKKPESNKIRFRKAQSAKKNVCANKQQLGEQNICKPNSSAPLTDLAQNRSQVICLKLVNKDSSLDSTLNLKKVAKLPELAKASSKQNYSKQKFITEYSEEPKIKLAPQNLRSLVTATGQKQNEMKVLKQKIEELKQENKKLRQMLKQMPALEETKIQLRISLKCIQAQGESENLNNMIEIGKEKQSQDLKIKYLKQNIQQLQFALVSQNKEIERLTNAIKKC